MWHKMHIYIYIHQFRFSLPASDVSACLRGGGSNFPSLHIGGKMCEVVAGAQVPVLGKPAPACVCVCVKPCS